MSTPDNTRNSEPIWLRHHNYNGRPEVGQRLRTWAGRIIPEYGPVLEVGRHWSTTTGGAGWYVRVQEAWEWADNG